MNIEEINSIFYNNIHKITTSNELYGSLYYSNNEVLTNANIMCRINIPENKDDDNFYNECKFILDNIISQIIRSNFNEDYNKTKEIGNYIIFKGEEYYSPFIINKYIFSDDDNIMNLEDANINMIIDGDYVRINVTVDVPKLINVYQS